MRKFAAVSMMIFCLAISALAEVDYNYALGKTPVGTFTNNAAVVDDALETSAISGNIKDAPQFLTVDLGRSIYVGSIRLSWDEKALSNDYDIRVSNDKKSWSTEFSGLNAADGILDAASGTVSQIISTARYTMPSRYIQLYIPIGSNANAAKVAIAEVQVLAAKNLSFNLIEVRPYSMGSQRAIIVYKTSIGAVAGQVLYGKDPNNLDRIAANTQSGVFNSAVLTDLDPKRLCYFKVKAWDAFGNMVESVVDSFKPSAVNLAFGKNVTGTFTELPPNDSLVDRSKPVLARAVDGITGYFKGMATSGSLKKQDQEVTVDLGSNRRIDSVISYWRALAYPESYSVKISNDNIKWTDVASQVNAADGAFIRSDAGDPVKVVNTPAGGASARYVKVFVSKDSPYFVKHSAWDFVQLMELEVLEK